MKTEPYIDRTFRGYGEKAFGKAKMDLLGTSEVEEARCTAFQVFGNLVRTCTRQEIEASGTTVESLFCDYVKALLDIK